MSHPEPTELAFLSDLDSFALEKKVRFLGWYVPFMIEELAGAHRNSVRWHDVKSASLFLTHQYPSLPYQIIARVNIDHVLDTMNNVDFQIGAWLNVTGYTCSRTMDPQYPVHLNFDNTRVYSEIGIRAIMIWNAASLDLAQYEKALQARKDAGTIS